MKVKKKLYGIISLRSYRKILKNIYILAEQYGQLKSIKQNKCIDKNGTEIPWYTYPAYEYLNSLDFSDKNILEFGSGASSSWWAGRAKYVISVEHDKDWYEQVKQRQSNNLEIILSQSKQEYISGGGHHKFDVVVIDGQHRHSCAENLSNLLKQNALVILDNAERHPTTAKFIREKFDLIQVDMHGFGPINNYTWTTSLFFSRGFNFQSNADRLPSYSIGSLRELAE